MRQLIVVVTAICGIILLFGLANARTLRHYHSEKERQIATLKDAVAALPRHYAGNSESHEREIRNDPAPDLNRQQHPSAKSRSGRSDPFDRGRLNEKFDGEMFKPQRRPILDVELSGQPEVSAPSDSVRNSLNSEAVTLPPLPSDDLFPLGDAVEDQLPSLGVVPTKSNDAPAFRPGKSNSFDDDDVTSHPTKVSALRVTIVVTAQQQIRVLAEGKWLGAGTAPQIPDDAIVITAEEFQIDPMVESGASPALSCTGNVIVKTRRFTAGAARMSLQRDEIVLVGTSQVKAQIVKESAKEGADFHLSADKITFNLALDSIQIGERPNAESTIPGGVKPSLNIHLQPITKESVTPSVLPSEPVKPDTRDPLPPPLPQKTSAEFAVPPTT